MQIRLGLLFIILSIFNLPVLRVSGMSASMPVINHLDSVIFDLSQSVCTSGQVSFPVYFKADDPVYAVDFSLKFNPNGFTFHSVTNIQSGLVTSAYYNGADSTLRFTSYSITPMANNALMVSLRFNLPSANISLAMFDSVYTLLNGDDCSNRFINPLLPSEIGLIGSPVITPGDCSTLFINSQPGLNYLWSTGQTTSQIIVCLPGTYSVTVSSINGCSSLNSITISAPNPLPVELLYFSAVAGKDKIILKWATASEINCDYYIIERSDNHTGWQESGRLTGSGTTGDLSTYMLEDYPGTIGVIYYRLKQLDLDGTCKLYGPIHVSFNNELSEQMIEIRPNPVVAGNRFDLEIPNDIYNNNMEIYLADNMQQIAGHLLFQISAVTDERISLSVVTDQSLPGGLYWLIIKGEKKFTGKVLIVR